jgi:TonB family protein
VRPLAVLALACVLAAPGRAQEQPLVAGESGVPIPKRIKMVKPVYPPDAQAHGLRGIVILDLTIDKNGKVSAVDVVRSIPGLDDAAVEAVKQWEYEPVKLDGKPVLVRLSVPITFLMPVPEISRQEGIPELRQGAIPAFPKGVEARGTVSAVAELTVDSEGRVVEAELKGGAPPYSDALLQAVKTWLFTPDSTRGVMSFRVQADYIGGDRARVAVSLAGVRRSETMPPAAPDAAPAPAVQPTTNPPATNPPANPTASAGAGAAPAAAPPTPPPAAPPVAEPSPTPTAESPSQLPAAPVVEVLRQEPPPKPVESGISAVRDVTLGPGLPELSKGRRPVPPPFARMAGVSGTVRVRFAIDASGSTSIQGSEGPDLLRPAAEQAVVSWVFRRTATDRLRAVAEIVYREDGAAATVKLEE